MVLFQSWSVLVKFGGQSEIGVDMFNSTQSLSFEGVQRFGDFAGNIIVAEFNIFFDLFDAHH